MKVHAIQICVSRIESVNESHLPVDWSTAWIDAERSKQVKKCLLSKIDTGSHVSSFYAD
jgi:N-formylglutamate amidohydrolase